MMRLLILHYYGGIYLDTDVLVTRSFDDLDNAIGYQDDNDLNGAVLVFKNPHNEYIKSCIEEFNNTYVKWPWETNGPKLLSRVYFRSWSDRPGIVKSMPSAAFQFMDWTRMWLCFANTSELDKFAMAARLNTARPYAVHWNNHVNRDAEVVSGSVCEYLFTKFCVATCDSQPLPPASYPAYTVNGIEISVTVDL